MIRAFYDSFDRDPVCTGLFGFIFGLLLATYEEISRGLANGCIDVVLWLKSL